jgi:hypothetical protein
MASLSTRYLLVKQLLFVWITSENDRQPVSQPELNHSGSMPANQFIPAIWLLYFARAHDNGRVTCCCSSCGRFPCINLELNSSTCKGSWFPGTDRRSRNSGDTDKSAMNYLGHDKCVALVKPQSPSRCLLQAHSNFPNNGGKLLFHGRQSTSSFGACLNTLQT